MITPNDQIKAIEALFLRLYGYCLTAWHISGGQRAQAYRDGQMVVLCRDIVAAAHIMRRPLESTDSDGWREFDTAHQTLLNAIAALQTMMIDETTSMADR